MSSSHSLLAPPKPSRPACAGRVALAWLFAFAVFAGGLAVAACSGNARLDPLLREPALLIDGPSLVRLLERSRALTGTPLGIASARVIERVRNCREVAAHFAPHRPPAKTAGSIPAESDPADVVREPSLPERLVCRDDPDLDPALVARLERERGEHGGVLQWPLGTEGRLVLQVDVDAAGGFVLGGHLDDAIDTGDAGPVALLLPAETAPGDAAIDPTATLVHLRLRPAAGLRLSELIPQGSQGDRLFALKGRLLEGALLEGTLELAFVPPAPGGRVPLALIALHHRAAGAVESALAEALDQLEQTWGIERSERRFEAATKSPRTDTRTGGCYADLPILPEFAPCWLVTENALLLGYRAEALDAALAPPSDAAASASGLVVDLDRVRVLDEAMAGSPGASLARLYSRLELQGRTQGDGRVVVTGELRARP